MSATLFEQTLMVILIAIVVGALLAFPTSSLLLWFYRRAVLRAMSTSGDESVPVGATIAGTAAPPKPLRFASLSAKAAPHASLPKAWRAAAIYLAAGAAYALVLAFVTLLDADKLHASLIKAFFIFWICYWPAVLAVIVVAAEDRARKILVVLGYAAVYVPLAVVICVRNFDWGWKLVTIVWVVLNGPPTVLLCLFLTRRIRSVGPLVLVFLIIALLGAHSGFVFLVLNGVGMRIAVGAGVFCLLLFAVLGWLALRWIGALYSAKKFSDESLTVDVIFMLFGIIASLFYANGGGWKYIATGFVAFSAYKVVARIGFRFLPKTPCPKRLLLLRVFALGKRSERLFDAVRKAWLRNGAMAMIAGPDLITSAVEPYEFLGFLSGKLGRTFVGDNADLGHRVAAMDSRPDPDGRYRVAEFFCRADTWKPTMRRLVAESDAILMDLRSFSVSNQGCVYEVGRLLDMIELGRVVFLTDKTTDRSFLEATFQQQWSSLAVESPNRSSDEPTVRLFEVSRPAAAEIRALIGRLASS